MSKIQISHLLIIEPLTKNHAYRGGGMCSLSALVYSYFCILEKYYYSSNSWSSSKNQKFLKAQFL